jgi:hypothetical protein
VDHSLTASLIDFCSSYAHPFVMTMFWPYSQTLVCMFCGGQVLAFLFGQMTKFWSLSFFLDK